jgi:hypothetical protein
MNKQFQEVDESAGEPRIDEIQRLKAEAGTPPAVDGDYDEKAAAYGKPGERSQAYVLDA